jgi:hypothetical protein
VINGVSPIEAPRSSSNLVFQLRSNVRHELPDPLCLIHPGSDANSVVEFDRLLAAIEGCTRPIAGCTPFWQSSF